MLLLLVGGAFIGMPGQLDVATRIVVAAWVLGSLWTLGATLESRPHHMRWQALWLLSLIIPVLVACGLPAPFSTGLAGLLIAVGAFLSTVLVRIHRASSATVGA
jgi:hypothetical protein